MPTFDKEMETVDRLIAVSKEPRCILPRLKVVLADLACGRVGMAKCELEQIVDDLQKSQ